MENGSANLPKKQKIFGIFKVKIKSEYAPYHTAAVYTSSDENAAKVNTAGVITALTKGAATITVQAYGAKTDIPVTVYNAHVP